MRKLLMLTSLALGALFITGVASAEEEETPNPGLFGTTILEGWNRFVGVGVSGANGNTKEVKLVADLNGDFEDTKHRRKLISQLYIAKPDNPTGPGNKAPVDRKAFVEYEENWKPLENSLFIFGTGRYDYGRLEEFKERIAASAGIGVNVLKTDSITARLSAGAGFNHNWNGIDKKETFPEGVVRASLDYKVMKGVSFSTTHTYYPNLDETKELRVISNAEIKADIGQEGGLSASIGLNNQYDSIVEAPFEDNNLTYFMRLGYDF
ncbi:MAG: putative salt-induced outer membrane protein YdiY [Myxococcota bacterium]